ncbi:MAG: hypothetical protein NWQ32_01015, partial [Paracoccaceae bacterium]|nr:hypothetical protein [Paracoccaceae bacterium]
DDPIEITPETRVVLRSRNAPRVVAESTVARVGDGIEPFPPRLWPDPRVSIYGRAVVIAPVPEMDLSPGELLAVDFRPAR